MKLQSAAIVLLLSTTLAPAQKKKLPGHAVKKGSFTVWTVPEKPKLLHPYYVVIEVRIPKKLGTDYRVDDLSGSIRCNDTGAGLAKDYRQVIPWDKNLTRQRRRHTFHMDPSSAKWVWINRKKPNVTVVNELVRIAIKVPGPHVAPVRDTIRIESAILKEKQKLEIKFKK